MEHVGIDVAKRKVGVLWLRDEQTLKCKRKSFENNAQGHVAVARWLLQHTQVAAQQVRVVMEATSVYHEGLAQVLYEQGFAVHVVNPYKVKSYAKSIGVRTKNDDHDPMVIARYSVATPTLQPWEPEPLSIKQLKALLLRLEAVEKDLQRERNRLEKAQFSRAPQTVLGSLNRMIEALEQQRRELRRAIREHIDQDPQLKGDEALLRSIPGIGDKLAQLLLAVLHSRPFTRASQVGAYLGLAPIEEDSGDTVHKKPRLPKNGPAWIRAKLYFPAIVATRHNPDIAAHYHKLCQRGLCKKAAIGGAMRKLVHIAYGVLKHQTPYQPRLA